MECGSDLESSIGDRAVARKAFLLSRQRAIEETRCPAIRSSTSAGGAFESRRPDKDGRGNTPFSESRAAWCRTWRIVRIEGFRQLRKD
jgi:hypothetical protein